MFDKIEHIGIAVKNLADSNIIYQKLLNTLPYKSESVASEKVETSFFKIGESKVELLQGLDDDSPIAKFINKKGEGIHHIAFAVKDIVSEMKRLKSDGFEVLSDTPKIGADNKLVCFIHPKSANGVLIELCQERE
ncbi:MAG TPA: methylmalonyl-CoA epimerase [Cytophagaceae bacterium]|jgi:methylmalonyl-CoA/ethylmalonyl-CoA epimerase